MDSTKLATVFLTLTILIIATQAPPTLSRRSPHHDPDPHHKPPPHGKPKCPVDHLKMGMCVDMLGGLIHIVLGDPITNQCCPMLGGLMEMEAAFCLCTSIRFKMVDMEVYLPIGFQLLTVCGKPPPAGYTCDL